MNLLLVDRHSRGARVALTEGGRLAQLFFEEKGAESWAGRVVVGQVRTVLPGGFVFVDIGAERNAFMNAPKGHGLKAGQTLTVQVAKDGSGQKGHLVTREIRLRGRLAILFESPARAAGASARLGGDERLRLRRTLRKLLPENTGAIARTACGGMPERELREGLAREISALRAAMDDILRRGRHAAPRTVLHPRSESGLGSILAEALAQGVDAVLVSSGAGFFEAVRADVEREFPGMGALVSHYNGADPDLPNIFDAHSVSAQLRAALQKEVPLPCGGYITIEETEACAAVDVNTGANVGGAGYAATVLATNLEAARALAYHVRLRNLSGVVIVDFINMAARADRDAVLAALAGEFRKDRAPVDNLSETGLGGLVQFTRRKTRPPLSRYVRA